MKRGVDAPCVAWYDGCMKSKHHTSHSAERRARKDAAGPCPIMHACGGCAWLGVPYRKQLNRKQAAIEELFSPLRARFGWDVRIDPIRGMGGVAGEPGSLPSPRAFRFKATTPFAPGAHGAVRCGFYARGTHRLVPAEACPVEADGARQTLNDVARIATQLHIPAYDEDTRRGLLRYAVLRMGWRTDENMLTLVTSNRDIPRRDALVEALQEIDPHITCIAQNVNGRPGNAILGSETTILAGNTSMRDQLLGCTFEISPAAFYQTNPAQTEVLYRLAVEGMALDEGDVLLDAYCGSGTIGLCAARATAQAGHAITLVGVERNAAGVDDARRNAALNGFSEHEATFIAADATEYLTRAACDGARLDVIVLDPPRAGSTPAFLTAAAKTRARRIVYISCNPETQVRDLATLGEQGYRLVRLTPVDMFPHTDHIETVAVLERI